MEHMIVNRTVSTQLAPIHAAVILDLLLILIEHLAMVKPQLDVVIGVWYLFEFVVDIQECSDGTHSCSQICNNTEGSYHCLCFDGYQLSEDGFMCTSTLR